MHIITWNVNGIRAAMTKGSLSWLQQQDADLICLQEIKARPEQVDELQRDLPGYQAIWNPAERPGYSGVLTYYRVPLQSHNLGLGEPKFDIEGRVIRVRLPGFWLYNIYFPNGQRGHDRVEYKLDFYRLLLEQCDQIHVAGEKVVITGDFNTAHQEIDLANPKENANTSGFLPEERAWVDRYLNNGFVDAFRQLYPDRVQYTWWTYRFGARGRNIGWRLDYYLVSTPLMPQVKDVVVHDTIQGSDHCPVSLWIDA